MKEQESKIRLIVNADDFGLTLAVNRGIIEAQANGILTSATLMVNMPFMQDAVELAKDHPGLGIGVHINLSSGIPVLSEAELNGLVGRGGRFGGVGALMMMAWLPKIRAAIRSEIGAQVEKALNAGVKITHLDTHKHVLIHPVILDAVISAARDYRIGAVRAPVEDYRPYRRLEKSSARGGVIRSAVINTMAGRARRLLKREGIAVTDFFFGITRTGAWDACSMAAALCNLPPGTTELMVHPGLIDDELRRSGTRLIESREAELKALTSPEVKKAVDESGIHLVSFEGLHRNDA